MIKVKQIAHVCIFAHDLEKTRKFYEDVLGLDIQFNFLRDGKIFGFYLNCGGRSHVEVFQKDGTSYADTNQITHFCLEVEDLDSTNGTFVNDQRVRKAMLTTGDRLRIGRVELAVTRES